VSAGTFGRILPLASPASFAGARSPSASASIIDRPDCVMTLEATEVSLIPASWSTFSSRWISATRASIWVLRYRVSSPSSRIGGGGTKLGRTIPCAATSASHSASERSVLRHGTFFTCRALHSHTVSLQRV
jgi:hypothetical protein